MITEEEIEALIKKKKITKSLMPLFIQELIAEQLDVNYDGAFGSGKEEGIAETNEEWENKDPRNC